MKRNLREEIDLLTNVMNQLYNFNGKTVTPETKEELRKMLREIKPIGFKQINIGDMITLHMIGLPPKISEVVDICQKDNKINVNVDRLSKTIYGLKAKTCK